MRVQGAACGTSVSLNAALLLAGRVVSALATLAVLVAVGRLRGGAELGLVGVGLAIGLLFGALSDAGTASLLVRESSRDARRTGTLLGAFSLWRLVAIPVGLTALLGIAAVAYPSRPLAIVLPAAGLALQYFGELIRGVFISRERMLLSSLHTIVENVAWASVLIALLAGGASLETAFAFALVPLVASIAGGLLAVRLLLGVTPRRPAAEDARALAVMAAPFAAFAVLATAGSRIDTILIGAFVPGNALVAAGVYFTAARLIAAFEYLPDALSRSLYPGLSRAFSERATEVAELLRPAARFLLLIGVPIPFAVLVAGPTILGLLLGEGYASYGWILAALGAIVPLRYLAFLLGITLSGSDAQGRRVVAVSVALVATVIFDAVFLPRFGIVAAVVGAFGSAALVFAIYLRDVQSRFGSIGLARPFALTLIAAAAASAVALALRPFVWELGALAAFAVVYAVIVLIADPRALRPSIGVPLGAATQKRRETNSG